MPFCTNCGKESKGPFCTNCGVRIPVKEAAPIQPLSVTEESPLFVQTGKPKKNNLWVLLALAAVLVCVAAVFFIKNFRKPEQPHNVFKSAGGGQLVIANSTTAVCPEDTAVPETSERIAVTESAPTATDPARDENAVRFTTKRFDYNYAIGNKIFFSDASRVFYYENGIRHDICPRGSEHYAANGETLYTISGGNTVIAVDIVTGNSKKLFSVNAYQAEICGATQDELYIGTQASEEDWWGYTVSAYDLNGTVLRTYGKGLDADMTDGYLFLFNHVSDLRPQSATVIQAETQKTVYKTSDDMYTWAVEIIDGVVYSMEVSDIFYEPSAKVNLCRIGPEGRTILTTVPDGFDGNYSFFQLNHGYALVETYEPIRRWWCYSIPEGKEITIPFDDSYIETDINGNLYCVKDNVIYRKNASGDFVQMQSLPSSGNVNPSLGSCYIIADINGNLYCEKDSVVYRQDANGDFIQVLTMPSLDTGNSIFPEESSSLDAVFGDYIYYTHCFPGGYEICSFYAPLP